jgi:hypothetical protein
MLEFCFLWLLLGHWLHGPINITSISPEYASFECITFCGHQVVGCWCINLNALVLTSGLIKGKVKHWVLLQGFYNPSHRRWLHVQVGTLCHHVFLCCLFEEQGCSGLRSFSQKCDHIIGFICWSILVCTTDHSVTEHVSPRSTRSDWMLLLSQIASPSVDATLQRCAMFLRTPTLTPIFVIYRGQLLTWLKLF